MVPYIKRPPTIDMTIAGILMRAQCASKTGRAILYFLVSTMRTFFFSFPALPNTKQKLTYAHDNQEAGREPSKIDPSTGIAFDEIIGVRTSRGDPVRHGSQHIRRHHEEGEEVVEESGGKDDEEEADGEDLVFEQCQFTTRLVLCVEESGGEDVQRRER